MFIIYLYKLIWDVVIELEGLIKNNKLEVQSFLIFRWVKIDNIIDQRPNKEYRICIFRVPTHFVFSHYYVFEFSPFSHKKHEYDTWIPVGLF